MAQDLARLEIYRGRFGHKGRPDNRAGADRRRVWKLGDCHSLESARRTHCGPNYAVWQRQPSDESIRELMARILAGCQAETFSSTVVLSERQSQAELDNPWAAGWSPRSWR